MLALRLAFRNISRHWRHSMGTVIALVLGAIAVCLINGYVADVRLQTQDFMIRRTMLGHFIIEAQDKGETDSFAQAMSQQEIQLIERSLQDFAQDIEGKAEFLAIQGLIQSNGPAFPFAGFAYAIEEGQRMRGPKFAKQSELGPGLKDDQAAEILVGKGLYELLACDTQGSAPSLCQQQALQLTSYTESNQLNVLSVGLQGVVDAGLRQLEDHWLLMPIAKAREFYDTKRASSISVLLKHPEQRAKVLSHLNKSLAQSRLQAIAWEEHPKAQIYRENEAVTAIFRYFVYTIVFCICFLSLSHSLTRAVLHRATEIGTLRALGFKRSFIMQLFAFESLCLGFGGTLLGSLGAWLSLLLVNAAGLSYVPGYMSEAVPLRILWQPASLLALLALNLFLCPLIALVCVQRRHRSSIAQSFSAAS